jgi:hypothetical protein
LHQVESTDSRRLLLQLARRRAETDYQEVIMRYLAGFVAVATLALSSAAPYAAAQAAPAVASVTQPQVSVTPTVVNPTQSMISGRVLTPNGMPVPDAAVRVRNLVDGQIGGQTSTAASGQFSLTVSPGSYLIEVVDAGGQIIGTSPFIAATAGTAITGAIVTVSTGALSAVTTTAGLASTLGTTLARSVTYAAAAAGVAGVVTPGDAVTASPSR